MATQNNVNINVNVSDNGTTAKVNKQAERLKNTLDDAAKSASRVGAATTASTAASTAGGTAGSRAAAAAAIAPVSTARSAAAPTGSAAVMSDGTYGAARGVAGVTGASARDFARQASELDGLVRVYATFAANLYAVGAAFRALREAAATESLVKGLDSLGISSGKNLTSLSKDLVKATDGAISLREAMSTVATASMSGMNTSQIRDIAVVASKASQALGVNMTDALSRLSRGIVKIEPELLDELGIFVKVDEATSKYALSVGKTAASLSDFERRQAFANAALEEGKKKFAAIENSANPYDKLLASVIDLSNAGLNLVNNVLGPIVDLLSKSPTALIGIFALVAGSLLKQALPALGAWRESLTKAAEESARNAKRIHDSFMEYSIDKDLEQGAKRVKPIQDKLAADITQGQEALQKTLSSKSKILQQALLPSVDAGALVKSLDVEIKRRNTEIEKTIALRERESNLGAKADADKLASYDRLLTKQREDISNLKVGQDFYKSANASLEAQKKIWDEIENKKVKLFTFKEGFKDAGEWMRGKIAERAEASATSKGILSSVGADTETKGAVPAFKNMLDSIKNGMPVLNEFGERVVDADGKVQRLGKGLSGLSAVTTGIKGGFLIAGSAIGTAISAFSPYLLAIEAAVVAFGIFDPMLSKAAKEQQEFNSAVEDSAKTIASANKTVELYTEKLADGFSTTGITAFTNAISGISKSLDEQAAALDKFAKKAGLWDRLKDDISSVWGGSNLDKFKKNTAEAVASVSKALAFSSSGEASRASLAKILRIDPKDVENGKALEKAVDSLSSADLSKLQAQISAIGKEQEYATNAMNGFSESIKEVDKLFSQMAQSNAFTDIQGKIGVELVNSSMKLGDVLREDPLKALQSIGELAKSTKFTALLDPKALADLEKAPKLIQDINNAERAQTKQKDILDQARKDFAEAEANGWGDYGKSAVEAAEKAFNAATKQLEGLKGSADSLMRGYGNLVKTISDEGFRRIQIGLKNAQQMAAISVEQAKLPAAAAAGLDTSKREAELSRQELDIQRRQIEASFQAQLRQSENTDALTRLTTAIEAQTAAETLKTAKPGSAEYMQAERAKQAAVRAGNVATAKQALRSKDAALESSLPADAVSAARKELDTSDRIAKMQRDAALAPINAKAQIVNINEESKRREYNLKVAKDQLDLDRQGFELQQSMLNILGVQSNELTVQLAQSATALQNKVAESDAAKTRTDLENKLSELERTKAQGTKESYDIQVALTKQALSQLNASESVKKYSNDIKGIQASYSIQVQEATTAQNNALQTLSNSNQLQESRLALAQKDVDISVQLGQYTDRMAASKRTEIELQQQSLKFSEQELRLRGDIELKELALKQAEAERAAQRQATQSLVASGAMTTESGALVDAVSDKRVANARQQLDLARESASIAAITNSLTVQGIQNTGAMNDKLLAQKELFDSIASATASLSTVFGTLGESVGKFADALARSGIQSEANAKALEDNRKLQEDLIKQQDKGYDVTDKLNAAKLEGSALAKKSAKDELNSNIAVVASAKKMFGEKTAAAKALGAIEKVLHIQRIAMDMKELFAKLFTDKAETASAVTSQATQTATAEAGFLSRTATYISEIFAKFTATMGPWGWAAAAAVVAAIFGGGGGSKGAFVPTAEQRQETQGTAMGWDSDGNKVQTRRGVFGDTDAKSESIAKSLERIKEVTVEGLSYDNKVVNLLDSIDRGINNTAKSLYRVEGLRTGSIFGTVEGTSGRGLSGLSLGGKTTKEIIDSGIILRGTFAELASDVNESVIDLFETVKKTKKSWYGKTSTSTYTRTKEIDDNISNFFKDIYSNAAKLFVQVGSDAGISEQAVNDALRNIKIDETVSFRGLKGEDLEKELESVIGATLDDAAYAIFSSFDKFAEFGEGMLETVIRVTDTNEKVRQTLKNQLIPDFEATLSSTGTFVPKLVSDATYGLESGLANVYSKQTTFLGVKLISVFSAPVRNALAEVSSILGEEAAKALNGDLRNLSQSQLQTLRNAGASFVDTLATAVYTEAVSFDPEALKQKSYEITENLVALAGGIEDFVDRSNFYAENFMTEDQRLIPIIDSVGQELDRLAGLGYNSADGLVDTREEFSSLVQSLDLTTDRGQKAYTALMKLAPGFDAILKPTEELAEKIKSERDSLEIELERVKLLGDTAALRELEISKLDESNRAIKREIYYWEDLKTARDDAINKLGSMVTTFRDFAKQVSTFKTSLLLGSTSTATPLEKFATAQTEFETAYRNALAGDKDAMSKLTSSANTYLDLAKTVFASSTEYSNIFSSVVDKLTTAESVATTTTDTAELQLNALKDQTILLQNIDAGIAKIAGIGPAPIQAAATGGWRQGITLVGEEGPELVDFKTPARVYTANQTEGMFNVPSAAVNQQQALIAEVQALRKEVVKLREQQRTETGHLINATYDAQTRNADIITDELAANISRAAWKQQVSQTAVVK